MAGGAQLSVTDLRRSQRHPVDYPVIAEHRQRGDMPLHLCNVSAHGFMIDNATNLARGDRLVIRLPGVGRIEAYCIWVADHRAGFQLERILRLNEFNAMLCEMQPNPLLRPRRR